MDYIACPRELYKIAWLSKATMAAVTTEMVVRCAMHAGGRSYQCMQILNKLMEPRAIYPPSALRLLRLVNGKRCEFCNNEVPKSNRAPWDHFIQPSIVKKFGPFPVRTNPKPAQVRRSLGLFACYICLSEYRPPSISKSWPFPCLTRHWDRYIWSDTRQHLSVKQFWVGNRIMMYEILAHSRVLAYPGGLRPFDTIGLEELRSADNTEQGPRAMIIQNEDEEEEEVSFLQVRLTNSHKSRDRLELMQAGYLRDSAGELIGSLINHKNLKNLTSYMKDPNSHGIDFFIDHLIESPPRQEEYIEFLDTYKRNFWKASRANAEAIRDREAKREHALLNKIERTIEAIGKIVSCVTLKLVRYGLLETCQLRPSKLDVNVIKRLLLCYREEHARHLRYRVTYDTGLNDLNMHMHCWLKDVLCDPRIVLKDDERAKKQALEIVQNFGRVMGMPRKGNIPNVVVNGQIQTGSLLPHRGRSRRRDHSVWVDRSRYRRNI